jgi:hypothetical protein
MSPCTTREHIGEEGYALHAATVVRQMERMR